MMFFSVWTGRFSVGVACAFAMVMFSFDATAAPSINSVSGNVADGAKVTISGSGFGTKAQAAPRLWDSVDNQSSYQGLSDGQTIPTGSGNPYSINTYNNPGRVKYATSGNRHSRSNAHYRASNSGYLQWPRAAGGEGGAPGSQKQLYVSYWFKPSTQIPDNGHSSKFFRIWDDPNGNGTRISWTQVLLAYDGGEMVSWQGWGGQSGQWSRLELYINADTREIKTWTNGRLRHDVRDFQKVSSASNRGFNLARVGFDGGGDSPPTNLTIDFGEVYVDVTQARVEIGNAAKWSDVTHKELQIPVSWSNSSVSIDVNQGSFNALSGLYLYVVDANGNVNSSGYPLCSNCPAPPAEKKPNPPEDLRAN